MPDRHFTEPRLAEVYDDLDSDRSDLDHYAEIVAELGAQSVIDVGCGTGTFACRLALDGLDVIGVDPAGASLDVARAKDGAERVRWLEGDATVLTELDQWLATLAAVRAALNPSGPLVFETRDACDRSRRSDSAKSRRSKRPCGIGLPGGRDPRRPRPARPRVRLRRRGRRVGLTATQ